jgi:hypothetical protein
MRSVWNSDKVKFVLFYLWDVTMPLWLCGSRHFEGPCCLHLQRFDVHEECRRGFGGDYGQRVTTVCFSEPSGLGLCICATEPYGILHAPWNLEDEGDTLLWNVGSHLPCNTASLPGDQNSPVLRFGNLKTRINLRIVCPLKFYRRIA